MTDIKNIALASISSATSYLAAVEFRTAITIVSSIVLPVVFFCIGKYVDVRVQIYLKDRADKRRKEEESNEA